MPYRAINPGDGFVVTGPAGGGYGNSREREPQRVLADLLDGFISSDVARSTYGVVINDQMQLDIEATTQLRQ